MTEELSLSKLMSEDVVNSMCVKAKGFYDRSLLELAWEHTHTHILTYTSPYHHPPTPAHKAWRAGGGSRTFQTTRVNNTELGAILYWTSLAYSVYETASPETQLEAENHNSVGWENTHFCRLSLCALM